MEIEYIRITLGVSKNKIYQLLSRKRYDRIIKEPESATLDEISILSEFFGISLLELLNILGFSEYTKVMQSPTEQFVESCVDAVRQKEFKTVSMKIDYLEDNNLIFKNLKYLDMWILLKNHLTEEAPAHLNKKYSLNKDQINSIISYYENRNKRGHLLVRLDLQVLNNLLASEIWMVDQFIELTNQIIDLELISKNKELYRNFLYIIINALYYSFIHDNYTVSKFYLDLYKKNQPQFKGTEIRADLQITILFIENILLYRQSQNDTYLMEAMTQYTILTTFEETESTQISRGIYKSVQENNKKILKTKETYIVYQRENQ